MKAFQIESSLRHLDKLKGQLDSAPPPNTHLEALHDTALTTLIQITRQLLINHPSNE